MKFYTRAQFVLLEQCAAEIGLTELRLMENAGSAAARVIRERYDISGKLVTVLCGKGNNGGDGFVAARRLKDAGAQVQIILADGETLSSNAQEMFSRTRDVGIPSLNYDMWPEQAATLLQQSFLIVDAVYGIGFQGEPSPAMSERFFFISGLPGDIVALDIPSGVHADTGQVKGGCIHADLTVCFHALKPGLVIFPGARFCGELLVAPIGIPEQADDAVQPFLLSVDCGEMIPYFGRREIDAHKGDFGRALLLCGSRGMSGAAVLSAKAALRAGAGLVTLGAPLSAAQSAAAQLTEPILAYLPEDDAGGFASAALPSILDMLLACDAALIGCGVGRGQGAQDTVLDVLRIAACPLVVDADGLNIVAEHMDILKETRAEVVLTPHPGEMARLTGKTVAEVQSSRLETATVFAKQHRVTVVLKGANSIVAFAGGEAYVNMTGNPGMATPGSGDVLAGIIVSLLAQGLPPKQAVPYAVYLHGLAGDHAAASYSQRGMTAGDIIAKLPGIFLDMEAR